MRIKKFCRICNGKLQLIIDLGKIALIGNFSKSYKKQKKYKISLNYCIKCFHVQIAEIVNPNEIFKNYMWETGISKTNIKIIDDLINQLKKKKLSQSSKVLEIASNDGTFVNRLYKKIKCQVIGIDPAKNLNKLNFNKSTTRISSFFNYKNSIKLKKQFNNFDFIVARNVVAHIEDPKEIFKGSENLLNNNGVLIVEVPHLYDIVKYNQYDNIFHEHIGFHSLKSIYDMAVLNNLKLIDVEKVDSQGGSIRCFITKFNSNFQVNTKNLKKYIKKEYSLGLYDKKKIISFKNKILNHQFKLFKLIQKLKAKKQKISAYGASGKGLALYQYAKLNNQDLIDYIFDKSKLKQNKFAPGSRIKVLDPSLISKNNVDYLILLTWNIKKEIAKQEKFFLSSNGKFITPFPIPKIIG